MVVAATGRSARFVPRLLAMVAEEVYMVSPETAKLLSLKGSDPEGVARRQAVSVLARRQGHCGHGHDRHGNLGGGQEGPRHNEGQARVRDHGRGPSGWTCHQKEVGQNARTCW